MLLGDEQQRPSSSSQARTHELGVDGSWQQSVHDGFVASTQLPPAPVQVGAFALPPLTPSQQAGSAARQRQARGRLPLLELHVRRSLREQRVAAGDPGLPHEGHLGQLRARRRRTPPRRSASTNDTMITGQGRRPRGHAALLHDAGPGAVLDRARARRRSHRRRPGRRARRTTPSAVDTYKVRTTAGFDIAVGATVTATGKSLPARERPGALGHPHRHHQADAVNRRTGLATSALPRARSSRSPTTSSAGTRAGRPRAARSSTGTTRNVDDRRPQARTSRCSSEKEYTGHRWGMAIDLIDVHRLQRVHGRVPGREQRPGRRPRGGLEQPRDALDPHRPLLQRAAVEIRDVVHQPVALPAVRERAVRAGLPGRRDRRTPTRA